MFTNEYDEISWIKVGITFVVIVILLLLGDFLFSHTNDVSYITSHITRMEESSIPYRYCVASTTTHREIEVSNGHGGYTVQTKTSTTCAVYAYSRKYTCEVYAGEYSEIYSDTRCFNTDFYRGETVDVKIVIQQDFLRLFPSYEVDKIQAA
jgi:hypothetical protein